MIICVSPANTDDDVLYESVGRRSFRWVLEVGLLHASVNHEFKSHVGEPGESPWGRNHAHFGVCLTPLRWQWGFRSVYHDGEWCSFNFGPLQIHWHY